MSENFELRDAFASVRNKRAVSIKQDDETIMTLLDWRLVRSAAQDHVTFSSNAPFRVPIPSEEAMRSVRQLPIELDPPLHTDIRRQLEPWFRRPKEDVYLGQLRKLVLAEIRGAKSRGELDLVRDLALPLQSRSLALLLNMAVEAAAEWIGWGTHVFRDGDDAASKGKALDGYIRSAIKRAVASPGDDFFSALHSMTLAGRALDSDQMAGVANLIFAGGRDTVINMITTLIVYFADRRETLNTIVSYPRPTNLAIEELLRVTSPLTQIGRVCPHGTEVDGTKVAPDRRVSLCWAAANYDHKVFAESEKIDLARSPNPHVAFGSGTHNCLGAHQARAIMRLLVEALASDTETIEIVSATPNVERIGEFVRSVGFAEAVAKIS